MSIFRHIKSLFIVEQADGDVSKVQPTYQAESEADEDLIRESPEGASGKVVKQFADILIQAMQAQNIKGFDYLEFKQSLRSLKDVEMDEATRFKSAFAMARTMGATPTLLVDSARFYIDVLKKEEAKFEQALTSQRERKVHSRVREIEALKEKIEAKTQQIEQLKQEVEEARAAIEKLEVGKADAEQNVDSTRNDFIASYNTIGGQIKEDIRHIREYLNE